MTSLKERAQAVLDAGEGLTPGPWGVVVQPDRHAIVGLDGAEPMVLAICFIEGPEGSHQPTCVANARAIAMAPGVHAVIRDLLAESARLRDALSSISEEITFEINPSNYDHDQVCEMNTSWCQIGLIADTALTEGGADD